MLRRDRVRWAVVAAAAALAFVAVGFASTRTGWGAAVDGAVASWVLNGLPEGLRLMLSDAARPLVIVVLTPAVTALVLLALARRSWRRAAAGALIPSLVTLAALGIPMQRLLGTATDSFPSHHAAVGMGLVLAFAVVWPRPVGGGWLVALGAACFLVALGNVSWYAHQPRDVVGSALLVIAVAAATFALLGGDSPNLARAAEDPARPEPAPLPSPCRQSTAAGLRQRPSATPSRARRRSPPT